MPENKKSSLYVHLANPVEELTNMSHQIKIEKENSTSTIEKQLAVQNEKINSLTEELHIARCTIYAKNKLIATLKESLSKSNEKLELSVRFN
jgi:septal ring factor EnvC (AmiA/AmiB activator)